MVVHTPERRGVSNRVCGRGGHNAPVAGFLLTQWTRGCSGRTGRIGLRHPLAVRLLKVTTGEG